MYSFRKYYLNLHVQDFLQDFPLPFFHCSFASGDYATNGLHFQVKK